ncbi:MAG: sulfurtransferase complex subunit TusD [Halioglobus sp.]|nr:sulfurtransferase complex subunit TusD [Halioglobus sp.]
MIYSLLVLSSPASGHGARHAVQFARSALQRGHTIDRVFFLDDGTFAGSAAAVFPQDEASPLQCWVELSERHALELILCVSSALKRGLLDAGEAQRHERCGPTIHPAFVISGLGQLVDAMTHCDRLVTFGG